MKVYLCSFNIKTLFLESCAKAETPILWPPHAKSWLIGKDSDAGRDWGQEEMAGWHLWLDGRESEWTPGIGDGQGGLVCCCSWGRKELDMTEWQQSFKQAPNMLAFPNRALKELSVPHLPRSLLQLLSRECQESLWLSDGRGTRQ